MRTILLILTTSGLARQSGLIQTTDIDLGYEVYGASTAATPVIVANGGPDPAHTYMIQNDVGTRLSNHRPIVFYDQRGTGKSTRLKPNAFQDIDAEVTDLEAVRTAWNIYQAIPGAKFVVVAKIGLPSYEGSDKYVQVLDRFPSRN